MAMFFNRKRPLLKSERYYEDETDVKSIKDFVKFPVFVAVALLLVVVIVVSIFMVNYNNNTFVMFNKASVKNFDCGSFAYDVSATLNDKTVMSYDGAIKFDLNDRQIESVYHAVYEDYEFDAITYAEGASAVCGNYYGGKWTVDDYTDRALDFYGFYNDYRKGKFDASALIRFTQTNNMFSAGQLQTAVESIIDELTKPTNMRGIMHQQVSTVDNVTTVSYSPEMDKLFDVMISHIGPAFTSVNTFTQFKEDVENSKLNLQSTDVLLSYTIDSKGYLTDIFLSYTIDSDTFTVDVHMSDFKEAEVEIPESFYVAAGID